VKEQNEGKNTEAGHEECGTGPENGRLASDDVANLCATPTRDRESKERKRSVDPMPRIPEEDEQPQAEVQCCDDNQDYKSQHELRLSPFPE
jgi:hypothetical protein